MAVTDRGPGCRDPRRVVPRGFALLIVLGTLGVVALIGTTLAAAGRADMRTAAVLRDAARARAAADGGIDAAIFAVLRGTAVPSALRIGDAAVTLRTASEAGRINPNVVPAPLLAALLAELGVAPAPAAAIADAIVDWRSPGARASPHGAKRAEYERAGRDYGPPGSAFRDIAELRLVLGMTDTVFAALAPHLTLWWDSDPVAAEADPVVRRAIADFASAATGGGTDRVLSIFARADLPGAVARRQAVVRFSPTADGRDIRILSRGDAPD